MVKQYHSTNGEVVISSFWDFWPYWKYTSQYNRFVRSTCPIVNIFEYMAIISLVCSRVVFGVFFLLNLVLWTQGSSAAIPFSTLIALLALWFGISVPLTFVGAYFGYKKRVSFLSHIFLIARYLEFAIGKFMC